MEGTDQNKSTVIEMFADVCRRVPDAEAVREKNRSWTYRELNVIVLNLTKQLLQKGISAGDVIAIHSRKQYLRAQPCWQCFG
ncbi:MAG: hypothetical protein HC764_22475 [Pleurocapsa sp. CRU_1_2]|nr:hypothetical protein [Pleurocapsa sp. CRU_1_2]